DGRRDRNVTGVQTCALPILHRPTARTHPARPGAGVAARGHVRQRRPPVRPTTSTDVERRHHGAGTDTPGVRSPHPETAPTTRSRRRPRPTADLREILRPL